MKLLKEIKYGIQRIKRGYSDRDTWDFNSYLNSIIPKAVRKIKDDGYGCPSDLYDSKNKDNFHKWKDVLEDIAQGFESAEALDNMRYFKHTKTDKGYLQEVDNKKLKQLTDKFDKGIKLFTKYYMGLWD